jgi:hypothetical protein
MLKIILSALILTLAIHSPGQTGFGVDVGYATANAVLMNLRYIRNANAFSIGSTYEFNVAKGKKVKAQLPGYGQEMTGDGHHFYSVDLGYMRRLSGRCHAGAEISMGGKTYYNEYRDNRFSGGGYHLVTREKFVFAFGVRGAYDIDEMFGVFAGLHTMRHFSAGLQLKFLK